MLPEEEEYGTEESCPKSPSGQHEPDWTTLTINSDGGEMYLDILCVHCFRSGCAGTAKDLKDKVMW